MDPGWEFNATDRRVAEELQDFLPARAFDMHAHLYRLADLATDASFFRAGPPEVTVEVWREHMEKMFSGWDLAAGLFFPAPFFSEEDVEAHLDLANDFLVDQLGTSPACRGLLLIGPQYSEEKALAYLENSQLVGFKPYHTLSPQKPTLDAPLAAFLPEWAWKLAHERGLVITLHMVRRRALADPDNQREIRTMCLKYPNARLILAHAARGFHAPNTIEGLPALRGLENIWFDTAAICEPAAILAILREFGPRRLLWGSDFPVSELRGKAVTVGDYFAWLQWDTVVWDSAGVQAHPTLLGLESLRALRQVADAFGLNEQDLEDIFYNNAHRVLRLCEESGTVTQDLYGHAKHLIPGGTQLLSKRPEMFAPDQWPPYFREARGCETWDLDGRHYYDMSTMGIGSCLLGFRDPDVTRAVQRCINLGAMATLNPPEEVELADLLCALHPWAERVRFARTGGEAMAAAVRIARATTGRTRIAICGYHGWHDWYLAANLGDDDALQGHLLPGLDPRGVPTELRGSALTFHYNDTKEFDALVDAHGHQLAAVVMEPCRNVDPEPGFLERVRERVAACGALWVIDEISIGFRLALGGAHLKYGVTPDIAVFAKALGNGHPMAAIIGTDDAMRGAEHSFISSTYWTESVGPAAALATIRKMQEADVPAHVARIGAAVQEHWRTLGAEHGLPVEVSGFPCLARFAFKHEKAEALRTLYTQWMLECGFLAGTALYPCLAHTDALVERYAGGVNKVFARIAGALAKGEVEKALAGPVAHSGFQRLT